MDQQRAEQRRHAAEDRRAALAQDRADDVRRRAAGLQHRRRTDRHRERERVAEPVREEQLRSREDDVVFAHAEHVAREQLGGADHARLHVQRALRLTGGTRRVEPEADVVGPRRRGLGDRRRGVHQRGERGIARVRQRAARIGDDEAPGPAREARGFFVRREQLRRDDRRLGATVGEDEREVERLEQRVDRDRNDAGLDRAEERRREVDRVEQAEHDALLDVDAERAQRAGAAVDAARELAVGARAVLVDERRLLGTRRKVPLDQIDGGVVERRCGVLGRRVWFGRRGHRAISTARLASSASTGAGPCTAVR